MAERDALWAHAVSSDGFVDADVLHALALFHWLRYQAGQSGRDDDLRQALHFYEVLRQAAPEAIPPEVEALLTGVTAENDPRALADLAVGLFQQAEDLAGIDRAIGTMRQALELTPEGAREGAARLAKLGTMLRHRYEASRRTADLTEAVTVGRRALAQAPEGNPGRLAALNNLALTLRFRYERSKVPADLEEATGYAWDALSLLPAGHQDRGAILFNLALMFHSAGDTSDHALNLMAEALENLSPGHSSLGEVQFIGGGMHLNRFLADQGQDRHHLDMALKLLEAADQSLPPGSPNRLRLLMSLSICYDLRFELNGDIEDLDRRITVLSALFERDRSALPHLAAALGKRADHTSALDERVTYVDGLRAAHSIAGHEHKAELAGYLGHALVGLYRATDDLTQLDEAIGFLRDADHLDPLLIAALRLRYARTKQAYDLEEVIRLESSEARAPGSIPADLRSAARELLVGLDGWTLGPGRWAMVEGELDVLETAFDEGDVEAVDAALIRLRHMAPLRVSKLGEEPLPPPPTTRHRRNRLIHRLDAVEDDKDSDDAE
ncbi:CATRA system-associated protein [Nonomuraea polychroma]|uniref:CATRA system-associated protein n=1 Tax=Nonomuraea polychroma TaxID=46176 RepID=UPI003D8C1145